MKTQIQKFSQKGLNILAGITFFIILIFGYNIFFAPVIYGCNGERISGRFAIGSEIIQNHCIKTEDGREIVTHEYLKKEFNIFDFLVKLYKLLALP